MQVPQIGCKIYKSDKIEKEALQGKLLNYVKKIPQKGVSRPLVENVEDFSLLDDGVEFKFKYDYIQPAPYREDETQKVLRTAEADVRIIDLQNRNLYLIYSSANIADKIQVRLSMILHNSVDFIEEINIPRNVMKDIENDDAIETKFGWWSNIETYADRGALRGNLSKSKSRFYRAFDSSGEPTYIMFESRRAGRTIRITERGIIALYGNISKQEVEEYINQEVVSRLPI